MKKTKIILTTLIIMLAIILLNTSEVHASLQAIQTHTIRRVIMQQIG